jgi:hypothetical protein
MRMERSSLPFVPDWQGPSTVADIRSAAMQDRPRRG